MLGGFFIVAWIRVGFILKVVNLVLKLNNVKVWSIFSLMYHMPLVCF